jgi:hypothetical protein
VPASLTRRTLIGASIGLSLARAVKAETAAANETAGGFARRALNAYAVDEQQFSRNVLYTWTTPDQVAELRAARLLLNRSMSPLHGPSGFDKEVAATGGPMAELLRRRQLSMRRFAWPSAWATALGFQGESYGDQLIRVTLEDSAIIAAFTPGREQKWKFRSVAGNDTPIEILRDQPERLAAIYFEATGGTGSVAYREYVLCNESMIATWEYATPAVLQELNTEEVILRGLIDWASADKDAAQKLFATTAAFPGNPYTVEAADIEKLADTLRDRRAAQSGWLSVNPKVSFQEIGSNTPQEIGPEILGQCGSFICSMLPTSKF